MKERGGMPYDVVAYEADELAYALTEGEEGIFHRMMRRAWMNGSVPADLDALAALCRVRPSTMKKAWPNLSKLWVICEHNAERLQNKKQESERDFIEYKRSLSSHAGKLSAKAKKEKEDNLTDVEPPLKRRATSRPSPPRPNKGIEKPSVSLSAYGEFGHVKLSDDEYGKLKLHLNGSLDHYINRFDRWAEEEPKKTANRKPYLTIRNWFDRYGAVIGEKPHEHQGQQRRERETHAEAIERKNREAVARAGEVLSGATGVSDWTAGDGGQNSPLCPGT